MVNGSARAQLPQREVRPRLSPPKPRSARVSWNRCRTETESIKQDGGTGAATPAHCRASQACASARPRDHSRRALRRKRDQRQFLARPCLSVMPHRYPRNRRASGHVKSSGASSPASKNSGRSCFWVTSFSGAYLFSSSCSGAPSSTNRLSSSLHTVACPLPTTACTISCRRSREAPSLCGLM